jgi:hypothetical protein
MESAMTNGSSGDAAFAARVATVKVINLGDCG